jgi:hypothetical protein
MTDLQATASATNIELVAAAGNRDEAADEARMPFGVMVFAVVAFGSEALWLSLIGWWLLNLF